MEFNQILASVNNVPDKYIRFCKKYCKKYSCDNSANNNIKGIISLSIFFSDISDIYTSQFTAVTKFCDNSSDAEAISELQYLLDNRRDEKFESEGIWGLNPPFIQNTWYELSTTELLDRTSSSC